MVVNCISIKADGVLVQLNGQLIGSYYMYFPSCWKTYKYKVCLFSKLATSENAHLKNYVLTILQELN